MDSHARTDDALYVTNKALARIEGLVAAGDVELTVATIARRAMEAVLSEADAVWQARDNVRQSFCDAEDGGERLVMPSVARPRPHPAAAAPMGFHEPERAVEKKKRTGRKPRT